MLERMHACCCDCCCYSQHICNMALLHMSLDQCNAHCQSSSYLSAAISLMRCDMIVQPRACFTVPLHVVPNDPDSMHGQCCLLVPRGSYSIASHAVTRLS